MQELTDLLMKRLKVDNQQAQGGAAILFKAAKEKLGGPEFNRLLGSVPGLDSLMARAPEAKSGAGLLGGLAALAGGNAAIIASIAQGFSKLGLSTGHAQGFVPVILDFLRTKVGPDAVARLEKTLRA
jgi:hypothetical protein